MLTRLLSMIAALSGLSSIKNLVAQNYPPTLPLRSRLLKQYMVAFTWITLCSLGLQAVRSQASPVVLEDPIQVR